MSHEQADNWVNQLAADWRQADLSKLDAALCSFAEQLTRTPGSMNQSDVQGLRVLGLSDVAIHDAVQVVAYFNYINRVADGLGVEYEEFVRPWGTMDLTETP